VGHDADIAIVLEFGNASHRLVLSRQCAAGFDRKSELMGAKTRLDQAPHALRRFERATLKPVSIRSRRVQPPLMRGWGPSARRTN
jgi:hypothetical protein